MAHHRRDVEKNIYELHMLCMYICMLITTRREFFLSLSLSLRQKLYTQKEPSFADHTATLDNHFRSFAIPSCKSQACSTTRLECVCAYTLMLVDTVTEHLYWCIVKRTSSSTFIVVRTNEPPKFKNF